jgi:hypothetical protein
MNARFRLLSLFPALALGAFGCDCESEAWETYMDCVTPCREAKIDCMYDCDVTYEHSSSEHTTCYDGCLAAGEPCEISCQAAYDSAADACIF